MSARLYNSTLKDELVAKAKQLTIWMFTGMASMRLKEISSPCSSPMPSALASRSRSSLFTRSSEERRRH